MHSPTLLTLAVSSLLAASGKAAFVVDSSTLDWAIIQYAAGGSADPFGDQQTGDKEGDIVGNTQNASLFKKFDDNATLSNHTDGTLGFRVRVGAESNPPGYDGAFFVGLDMNNDQKLDLFLGVVTSGSKSVVGIYNPGTGLNNSPSTTSIVTTALYSEATSASNYSWMGVTTGSSGNDPAATSNDIDAGGKQDFFLSFALPFNQVILALNGLSKPGVTDATTMSFVAATSQQANSLNQDLNGTNGNTSSTLTFSQLGAVSQPYSASGVAAVPEPSTVLLCGFGLSGLAVISRYRKFRLQTIPA